MTAIDHLALEPIDKALTEFLLREFLSPDANLAYLLAHLCLAMRAGHVCIDVEQNQISPSVEELWLMDENRSPSPEECENIHRMIVEAAGRQPESVSLRREGSRFYFQRYLEQEHRIDASYRAIKAQAPTLAIDLDRINKQVLEQQAANRLQPEQARAILQACRQRLFLLCGGPGTGKTYTAGHLIRLFWDALTTDAKQRFKLALAAPTGKAAAQLQKSLGAIPGLAVQAQTLHRLLDLNKSKTASSLLDADLILIDESSMMDAEMIEKLFQGLKPGARLVLLGDPNQLPPVEMGGFFADFAALELEQGTAVALKACMRTDLQDIVRFASLILEGDGNQAWNCLRGSGSVRSLPVKPDPPLLLEEVKSKLSPPGHMLGNPPALLEFFNRYRILSPLRKGPGGVDALNEFFRKHLFRGAAPVMVTKNDRKLQLFNGETGVLVNDQVFFPGDQTTQLRCFPAALLQNFEYAYCLSVHKSQGSEFDHVLLLLPDNSDIFGREGLYTAVTRAKKQLDLAGSEEIFFKTLARRSRRLSGLKARPP